MGAQAGHAEPAPAQAQTRPAEKVRDVSGLEQLAVTAGNAAVSRLLGATRPPPPSAPGPREPEGPGPGQTHRLAASPLQRYALAVSPAPRAPAPTVGIVPAPTAQPAAPSAPDHADRSPGLAPTVPAQIQAVAVEAPRLADPAPDEQAEASSRIVPAAADRPTAGNGSPPSPDRLVVARALATAELDLPDALDQTVAPARGPPVASTDTSGSQAPASIGGATEPNASGAAHAEATEEQGAEPAFSTGPDRDAGFDALAIQSAREIRSSAPGEEEVARQRQERQALHGKVHSSPEPAATAVQRHLVVTSQGSQANTTGRGRCAVRPATPAAGELQGVGAGGRHGPLGVQRKAGSYAPPAPPVPPKPRADPRFTKVSGELKKTAKQTKAHPPGKAEAKKAADAAVPPANDKQAQAKAGQADKMAGAKKKGFDKPAFIAAVKQAITAAAPKTLEEADEFADSGKAAGVKDQVMSKVAKGKEESAKDVVEKTKEAPDPSKANEKPVKPLQEEKQTKPKTPDFAKAMPAKVPPEQTDFDGPKNEVNDKMAEADVSESDLKKSNEPQMMGAVEAKKEGDAQSVSAPKEIRAKEAEVLKKAAAEADQKGKGGVDAMAGAKKNALTQAGAKKADQKAKDEAKRAQIAAELNKIFDKTKGDVENILTALDGKVDDAFTKGEAEVRKAFTAEHKRELEAFKDRRYSGIDGKIQWGIDLFKDLSEVREVKQIYERAKANYEKGMERVISNVADVVGREIDRAKDRINAGRLEIKDWVTKQPKDIQKLAADAAKGMDDKFNQLEADVDAKSESLANDLAGKYTAALGEVNKEIEEAQAANKSAWSKAKAAIGDAIEAILKLKDLFMGMLAKAAGAFKKIIADPLKFIGNFMSAVKAGFLGFADRIGEHLKKGLQGWLFGKLAEAGIEIPDKLDLQGIIRMVLSILGLTWGAIRPKIVKIVGEKAMSFLETKAEVFMILVKEGVGGLWRWIVDKVGDLKEMVMGQIRDFVITKIVKAGITWVIGMLNPAGALIKIIQTLISVIQWIMEKGAALVELVGTIIDSVSDIANGGMGGVPAKIEGALGKAVPIVISFLASLLGLGGIGEKIKSILDAVRGPVGKALDAVIGGAVKLGKRLIAGVKGLGKKPDKNEDSAASKDVKARAKADIQSTFTGPVESSSNVKAGIDTIYDRYKKDGLHSIRLKPRGRGAFDVLVAASADEKATTLFLEPLTQFAGKDFKVRWSLKGNRATGVPHTALVAKWNGEPLMRRMSVDDDHHAEDELVAYITANIGVLARPAPGKRNHLDVMLTKSPCGRCGDRLRGFVSRHNATFTLRPIGMYSPQSPEEKAQARAALIEFIKLKEDGVDVVVPTVEEVLAEFGGEGLDDRSRKALETRLTRMQKKLDSINTELKALAKAKAGA